MKNKFLILIISEAILAVFILIWIILPDKKYKINMSDSEIIYQEGEMILPTKDNLQNGEDYSVTSDVINIPAGRYILEINYRCDIPTAYITSNVNGKILNESRDIKVFDNLSNKIEQENWYSEISNKISYTITSNRQAPLYIEGIILRQTDYYRYIALIIVLLCEAVTVFVYIMSAKKIKISNESIIISAGLCLIIILASIPLYNNRLLLGHDTRFHLTRIEGIKEGLLAGQFPVCIYPLINSGYGYATPLFYGDALLYIPAIMRLMGFTLQFSLKAYIFMINAFSTLTFYFCLKSIIKNNKYSLFGTFLFMFSTYHFADTYGRMSIGEISAWGFFPLVIIGLWNLYTMDIDDRRYCLQWIAPVIGFTGIIESHVISTELAGMATVLICLIMLKKTFRGKTFIQLLKIVGGTVLLNLYFILPFIDSMMNEDLVVTRWRNVTATMQENGIHILDLFRVDVPQMFLENRFCRNVYIGLGLAFGLGALIVIYSACRWRSRQTKPKGFAVFSGMAAFYTVLCLSVFPWNKIIMFCKNIKPGTMINHITIYIANAFSNIQWPYRFLTLATIFFAIAITMAIMMLNSKKARYISISLIAFILFGQYIWSSVGLMTSKEIFKVNNITMNDAEYANDIGNMEYYPMVDTHLSDIDVANERECKTYFVNISDYKKKYTNITLHASNTTEESGSIELPLFYYRGYVIENLTTGKINSAVAGKNKNVTFYVEPGEYDYKISYKGVGYWKAGYVVSLISLVLFAIYIIIIELQKKGKRIIRLKTVDNANNL